MANGNGVAASWNDILVLVQNIRQDMKGIENDNDNLESMLKSLRSSFRDEGFNTISAHVASTKKQIADAAPAFNTALKNMTAYAIKLKQSEDAMNR